MLTWETRRRSEEKFRNSKEVFIKPEAANSNLSSGICVQSKRKETFKVVTPPIKVVVVFFWGGRLPFDVTSFFSLQWGIPTYHFPIHGRTHFFGASVDNKMGQRVRKKPLTYGSASVFFRERRERKDLIGNGREKKSRKCPPVLCTELVAKKGHDGNYHERDGQILWDISLIPIGRRDIFRKSKKSVKVIRALRQIIRCMPPLSVMHTSTTYSRQEQASELKDTHVRRLGRRMEPKSTTEGTFKRFAPFPSLEFSPFSL